MRRSGATAVACNSDVLQVETLFSVVMKFVTIYTLSICQCNGFEPGGLGPCNNSMDSLDRRCLEHPFGKPPWPRDFVFREAHCSICSTCK